MTAKIILVLTEATWAELTSTLDDDRETAGVLAARTVRTQDETLLLVRSVSWAPEADYLSRDHDGIELSSTGWVPAARAAVAGSNLPIFVHTHPQVSAAFSNRDDILDAALASAFPHLGAADPYVSLVVGGRSTDATAAARTVTEGRFEPIAKIRVVGDRVRLMIGVDEPGATTDRVSAVFDRQTRVFGELGQHVLARLHAAVVGVGGTGSAVTEQLTRLGVGRLTLIDDDVVTSPTPTRGYGTHARDVGVPKVEVVAASARDIGLGTTVAAINANVATDEARLALATADVIFSCVDGHGGRLVLNRFAYAHLVPVIDVAVLINESAAGAVNIDGRVTWLSPGTACLLCRGRLDAAEAYAELLDPEERQRLAGEGYAEAAATAQPAVVTLTSFVASLATTELVLRLFGLAHSQATEILARVTHRELRRNRLDARSGCFCSDWHYVGRGWEEPHLDLLWPQ
jgi:molybdopterin/thiamine biosynthesis adenylyltransferase